jgi:hypothetical protein
VSFGYIYPALTPEVTCLGRAADDAHRQFNFDLCRALDMTKMGIVLGKMSEIGWLDAREAELLHLQASSLLALMRTANNRAYASAIEARRAETQSGSTEGESAASEAGDAQ